MALIRGHGLMSALHTHTPGTHTHTHTSCLEFTVLLLHSGKLNFTLLPPVTHTHRRTYPERGAILNRVVMNGAGKEPIKSV